MKKYANVDEFGTGVVDNPNPKNVPLMGCENSYYNEFAQQHPPLKVYNSNNELVRNKRVEVEIAWRYLCHTMWVISKTDTYGLPCSEQIYLAVEAEKEQVSLTANYGQGNYNYGRDKASRKFDRLLKTGQATEYKGTIAPISQPVKEVKSAEEILRQHLHAMSDEQFNEEIKHFPLCEVPSAMNRFHAQFTNSNMVEVEKVVEIIKEHKRFFRKGMNLEYVFTQIRNL